MVAVLLTILIWPLAHTAGPRAARVVDPLPAALRSDTPTISPPESPAPPVPTRTPTPTASATRAPMTTPTATLTLTTMPTQTASPTASPTATITPTVTTVPNPTVSAVLTRTSTPRSVLTATQTAASTLEAAVGTPGSQPPVAWVRGAGRVVPADFLPAPHLWLGRPFSAEYQQWAEPFYPYGSTADGLYVLHTGADFTNPLGTPVLAVADGEIVYAGTDATRAFGPWLNYYGNLIVLRLARSYDDAPVFVLYGHLSELYVKPGQAVSEGDVIAAVGAEGIAIGPHLHLEVRIGENSYYATRNPEFWLRPLRDHGVLAGRVLGKDGQPVSGLKLLVYRQARSDQVWQIVPTYLAQPEINRDDEWGENFLLADVPAGDYLLETSRDNVLAQVPFQIEPNRVTFVEIRLTSDE